MPDTGSYTLRHPSAGVIARPDGEWAECLREARLGTETIHVGRSPCDFNGQER